MSAISSRKLGLFLSAVFSILQGTAYASVPTNQVNSESNVLTIGAGGVTVETVTGNTKQADFVGPVTAGSLGVAGAGAIGGNLQLGTEGTGSHLPAGSEFGPKLSFGGASTNNADPIYLQRFNEAPAVSSLRLVVGGDAGKPYASGFHGDAFLIGTLDADNNNLWVPHFVFTSDGKLGIGTVAPQSTLDVQGEIRIGNTNVVCTSSNAGALRYVQVAAGSGELQLCSGSAWTSITATLYSTGGVDVVTEAGVGAFAYCRMAWGAAGCSPTGIVSCTRGTPQVTTRSHDDIAIAEVPSNSLVNSAVLYNAGAQITHTDCIVQ